MVSGVELSRRDSPAETSVRWSVACWAATQKKYKFISKVKKKGLSQSNQAPNALSPRRNDATVPLAKFQMVKSFLSKCEPFDISIPETLSMIDKIQTDTLKYFNSNTLLHYNLSDKWKEIVSRIDNHILTINQNIKQTSVVEYLDQFECHIALVQQHPPLTAAGKQEYNIALSSIQKLLIDVRAILKKQDSKAAQPKLTRLKNELSGQYEAFFRFSQLEKNEKPKILGDCIRILERALILLVFDGNSEINNPKEIEILTNYYEQIQQKKASPAAKPVKQQPSTIQRSKTPPVQSKIPKIPTKMNNNANRSGGSDRSSTTRSRSINNLKSYPSSSSIKSAASVDKAKQNLELKMPRYQPKRITKNPPKPLPGDKSTHVGTIIRVTTKESQSKESTSPQSKDSKEKSPSQIPILKDSKSRIPSSSNDRKLQKQASYNPKNPAVESVVDCHYPTYSTAKVMNQLESNQEEQIIYSKATEQPAFTRISQKGNNADKDEKIEKSRRKKERSKEVPEEQDIPKRTRNSLSPESNRQINISPVRASFEGVLPQRNEQIQVQQSMPYILRKSEPSSMVMKEPKIQKINVSPPNSHSRTKSLTSNPLDEVNLESLKVISNESDKTFQTFSKRFEEIGSKSQSMQHLIVLLNQPRPNSDEIEQCIEEVKAEMIAIDHIKRIQQTFSKIRSYMVSGATQLTSDQAAALTKRVRRISRGIETGNNECILQFLTNEVSRFKMNKDLMISNSDKDKPKKKEIADAIMQNEKLKRDLKEIRQDLSTINEIRSKTLKLNRMGPDELESAFRDLYKNYEMVKKEATFEMDVITKEIEKNRKSRIEVMEKMALLDMRISRLHSTLRAAGNAQTIQVEDELVKRSEFESKIRQLLDRENTFAGQLIELSNEELLTK